MRNKNLINHALNCFLGKGGLSSHEITFSSNILPFSSPIFILTDLLITGRGSLAKFLFKLSKFRKFYLFFSSKYVDLFYEILSTEDSNLCFGSLSFMLLKSLFFGGRIL